jgi:hypothetical protein
MSPSTMRLAATVLALGLVAAACGSDGGTDSPAAPATDAAEVTVDDDAMDDQAADDEAMDDEAMDDEMMEGAVDITVTIENISDFAITDSGAFSVPVSASEPGPVLPGDAYEFTTYANAGQLLSFATMFVQTNDWFFAPNPEGIALFDQEVGTGADQAPRQTGPDTGDADPDDNVRAVDSETAADYVRVTVTPGDAGEFTTRIDNVSDGAATPTPTAPGAYAVHDERATLFTLGEADAGLGLEALAEDGDPAGLAESLGGIDGVLHLGAFTVPDGASEAGPVLAGGSYSFTTPIAPGEPLSLATMFVQSNDRIFATPAEGIDVFDANGSLVEGEVSDQLLVVDVGSEIDQTPGFGADQAPRQAGPDTGDVDPDVNARIVDARMAADYVRVTVTLG